MYGGQKNAGKQQRKSCAQDGKSGNLLAGKSVGRDKQSQQDARRRTPQGKQRQDKGKQD